ncbi:hypothetical protein F5148DRAFT_965088, partial [Russula earlei]
YAQAVISPALGVKGIPTRDDVQRHDRHKRCGNIDINKTLDTSKAVHVPANGTFTVTIINFHRGFQGSRYINAVEVDDFGTGKNKRPKAKVVHNGDRAPKNESSQVITVRLPHKTKCRGGSHKDLCLVSFNTIANYGNCVVVSQGS